MPSLQPRRIITLALAATAGVLGCDDGSSPVSPEPGSGDLECEVQSYPCSPAEVELPILSRSNELGDSVLARLEGGASTAEAADWLEGQDGMADVMSGGLGVWFRLEGGRGTWVVTEGALLTEPGPGAAGMGPPPDAPQAEPPLSPGPGLVAPAADGRPPGPAVPRTGGPSATSLSTRIALAARLGTPTAAAATSADPLADPGRPLRTIVGSGSQDKRALILSPGLWEFGSWDSGPAVRDLLAATRGYEGGVTFVANTDSLATDVGLASFTGWGAYDVVHVMSHGIRVCDDAGCRGMLTVNRLDAFFPEGLSDAQQIEKLKEVAQPGVELVKSGGPGYLAVGADFFRHHASDLVDTVILLNACQLFGSAATDLVDALAGTGNVVFGWTEAVYAGDAYDAATALFKELSEGGYPAEVAYERIGDLRTGNATDHGPSPVLRIARRASGGDLQIREVVTLLNPASAEELTATDRVQIEGIPGDGEEDAAPFLVRVDGVLADQADDMTLHVSIDDVQADPVAVGSGTPNDRDQWFVEGRIPLGYDLEDDRPVDFVARVELVSEGESEHASGAILTGASWTLETEGEMNGEVTLHGLTARGGHTWTAEAGFAVDEEGRVVGSGLGFLSGTELVLSYDDEEVYCLLAAPVELGFVFDVTGQVQDGGLRLESANLQAAEFSANTCDAVPGAQIEASLLAVLAITLETEVPFQHEAVQEREVPGAGPLSHDGVVVGSYETFYRWVNTIRKEGCPVGGVFPDC